MLPQNSDCDGGGPQLRWCAIDYRKILHSAEIAAK
jgi:hypothetical protein